MIIVCNVEYFIKTAMCGFQEVINYLTNIKFDMKVQVIRAYFFLLQH